MKVLDCQEHNCLEVFKKSDFDKWVKEGNSPDDFVDPEKHGINHVLLGEKILVPLADMYVEAKVIDHNLIHNAAVAENDEVGFWLKFNANNKRWTCVGQFDKASRKKT